MNLLKPYKLSTKQAPRSLDESFEQYIAAYDSMSLNDKTAVYTYDTIHPICIELFDAITLKKQQEH